MAWILSSDLTRTGPKVYALFLHITSLLSDRIEGHLKVSIGQGQVDCLQALALLGSPCKLTAITATKISFDAIGLNGRTPDRRFPEMFNLTIGASRSMNAVESAWVVAHHFFSDPARHIFFGSQHR